MKIDVPALTFGTPLPAEHAFGIPADVGHLAVGHNVNPLIRWSDAPAGTKSFAVLIGSTAYGVRGINDYTGWFAGDPEMAGNHGGYDGPCPPCGSQP